MAPDFQDLAIERDGSLVQGMCQTARNNRRDLHEWIEEELKAVLIAAEIQESLAEGVIRDRIAKVAEDLRRIEGTELPEAIREHEDVRRDIENGGYDDVHEAYRNLERETARLVVIMRDLLYIREFIGEMGSG